MLAKKKGGGRVVQAETAACLQIPEWEDAWHLRGPESQVMGLERSGIAGQGNDLMRGLNGRKRPVPNISLVINYQKVVFSKGFLQMVSGTVDC